MNFLESIFTRLGRTPHRVVLQEVRDGQFVSLTCHDLLSMTSGARQFLASAGLRKGDRCTLLAPNGIRWVALDLAMMAEGIIVVPLYARQAPAELVGMMKDCTPSLICCGDERLREAIRDQWSEAPRTVIVDEIFSGEPASPAFPPQGSPLLTREREDAVTIIYTSGTSGEPKGVILTAGNLNHMLECTNSRLDLLMGAREEPDRVFHYLPFCFAGSWILLLTCLSRSSVLVMSADLTKLGDEMKLAAPHYFLNVPALLERICSGVRDQIAVQGKLVQIIFTKGREAWFRQHTPQKRASASGAPAPAPSPSLLDSLWLALARKLLFSKIKEKIGVNLMALICGSAPLAEETQLFFLMLGIPVLQVYGLTETTAICTMDHPQHVVPGRVGPAISQVEMKLGPGDEILVRGPNIFAGYWNRPEETAKALHNSWFHTGDRGEVDVAGNWSIIGRVKNLIIPASGHNIAPEPIEEIVLRSLSGAQQVMLVGNGRSFLSAIITGNVTPEQVEGSLATVNQQLPHYKRIHAFHISRDPFTIGNGLLTANGKLRREAIMEHYRTEIERLYRAKSA